MTMGNIQISEQKMYPLQYFQRHIQMITRAGLP